VHGFVCSVGRRVVLLDLGELNAPVLCFGGPYSNLQATKALKNKAEFLGIPPERIICTGDVVAYCANPQQTVDLIRDWGVHVMMGNCEQALGFDADDCGCGFDEGSQCDVLSDEWYQFASGRLNSAAKLWMRSLPDVIYLNLFGIPIAVIHGGVDDISAFVFHSTPDNAKQQIINELEIPSGPIGIIAGHSGLPFTDTNVGGDCLFWHNPGVIGMPANDGTPRAWYSVVDRDEDGQLCFSHGVLDYCHQGAAQAMIENGLSPEYKQSLLTGLWPNMDVLPEWEQKQQGQQIFAKKITGQFTGHVAAVD